MRQLSASDAARHFSQLLDDVERGKETITVMRRGRPVARIGPAPVGSGAALRDLIRTHPSDDEWATDLRRLREGLRLENRSWTG